MNRNLGLIIDRSVIQLFILCILLHACASPQDEPADTLLELLSSKITGISFRNEVTEDLQINVFTYTNFYNGGGVAIGDIDNDGLVDVYLSANSSTGKLYLNKGDFRFQDITEGSGMDSISGWKTGVTMVDINQDGFLDIYVCRSGDTRPKLRSNLLFVNNGDKTFTEKGEAYGLNDWGTSLHAAFFDYDLDGDLDMFLLNHAIEPNREIFRNFHDKDINRHTGDRIFRNDNGHFNVITKDIGINRSKLGDGLGAAVADFNNDLYPDIYVCNDFVGRDYLYFNQGDGTFKESALESMGHISYASMGSDAADIDNDGWQDLFVLDMRSSTNYGRKTNMASMNPEAFNLLIDLGGHRQYMRNTFQLNNGNETFSDIAPMVGVSSTDWSWAPLIVDLDNDGYKDLFVTNGMRKNTNNKDYISYKEQRITEESKKQKPDHESMIWEILDRIPEEKVVNLVYRNINGLNFENQNESWGLNMPSFSNGAAYADLDNDGDMDLIINNIDQEAHIYKNNASQITDNHFLKVKLRGSPSNLNGMGAKVRVASGGKGQYIQQQVSRGYQSSVDFILHFGLGNSETVDSLVVTWPDGKISNIFNVPVDQMVSVDYQNAREPDVGKQKQPELFKDVTLEFELEHRHIENQHDDFKKEILLPHKMSSFGPALAVGDVNRDGMEDFYIGGAMGFSGAVYTQQTDRSFSRLEQTAITADKDHEDLDAVFFDADSDSDLDLYVVSGGNELPAGDLYYQDRLYLNNGDGMFTRSLEALPAIDASGGVVRAEDFDEDGDIDLFVGGRQLPGQYPRAGRSYLLENTNGNFKNVTAAKASELEYIGMVTDAVWSDFDGDAKKDLIVVGEWMPITVFRNHNGAFEKVEGDSILSNSEGWWFSIVEADVNNDGRMDYIAGNLGENYKYKARSGVPFKLYSGDLDNNGSLDIVLSYYENDTLYPLRGKECSTQQMPSLKDKFKNYNDFGMATVEDVYGSGRLKQSEVLEAQTFTSSILMNTADGFSLIALPKIVQISAVFGIVYQDFDHDGLKDIVLAGNLYSSEVETPRSDAGQGMFLKGDGKGGFKPIRGYQSGLYLPGDVKKLKPIELKSKQGFRIGIIVAVNDGLVSLKMSQ